jgi:MFS family permease
MSTLDLLQLIGSIVGGHFGDHFGRKYGFAGGQVCIIITSMFGTAAKTWFAFAILQGLNGFLYGVIEVNTATISHAP